MKILGWLIAYWGVWMTLGSMVLLIRFETFAEEWQEVRELPASERMKLTYHYFKGLTLWPRTYRMYEFLELMEDDDNEDDHEGGDDAPEQERAQE